MPKGAKLKRRGKLRWTSSKRSPQQREERSVLSWEGTFSEYLDIVRKRPQVAQTAHWRVYNMIISHGVEVDEQGNKRYPFFSRELFGLDRAIERLVEEYFHSAASGWTYASGSLLLMGPVERREIDDRHPAQEGAGAVLPDGRGRGLRDQGLPDA